MPRRVNSTEHFDLAAFIVLRRGEKHAARTWLKAVSQHKTRLSKDFALPESVFVYMLLSQLTREERKSSIDSVDDPSGVIALTWQKAHDAVASLDPANHLPFNAKMCGSKSLAYHPLKAVNAKSSKKEKEAAKAGSTLAPALKNEVETLKNEAESTAKIAELDSLKLKTELIQARNKLKKLEGEKKRFTKPCRFHFSGRGCRSGANCRFSHDPKFKNDFPKHQRVSVATTKTPGKGAKKRKRAAARIKAYEREAVLKIREAEHDQKRAKWLKSVCFSPSDDDGTTIEFDE
jgi:hypothetical protein